MHGIQESSGLFQQTAPVSLIPVQTVQITAKGPAGIQRKLK